MGEPEAKIVEPIPDVLNYVLLPFQEMWCWVIKSDCFTITNNRSRVQTASKISGWGHRCLVQELMSLVSAPL